MIEINMEMKLKSPLLHFSDEKMGTMQIARTMKYKVDNEFIDIPVLSGNAFRGQLRRIAMKDYIENLEIDKEGISAKLYYMLFVGGALTSGSRFLEIGKKREMRQMCPPLSLFGTAIGDQIPEGKLKVTIFKPICRELNDYNIKQSNLSVYDMLEEIFYTRRDDLKSKDVNITDETKHDNAVQMKYEAQGLSSGTELEGKLIIENSNDIEEACLKSIIDKFIEIPFIGGKSATGHGEVEVKHKINKEIDVNKYYNYINDNKEKMISWLRSVEEKL